MWFVLQNAVIFGKQLCGLCVVFGFYVNSFVVFSL